MLKKFGIVAAGLLLSVTTLFADGQMKSNSNQKPMDPNRLPGGGTVGFSLTTLAGAVAQIGYTNNCVTFDIGGNFFHAHDDNFGTVLGHLGFRSRIKDNFFFSMGAMGLKQFGEDSRKQWSAGVFTGLDYQFSKHFMLQGKVYPYNYDNRVSNSNTNLFFGNRAKQNVFANSTIAFLYVF